MELMVQTQNFAEEEPLLQMVLKVEFVVVSVTQPMVALVVAVVQTMVAAAAEVTPAVVAVTGLAQRRRPVAVVDLIILDQSEQCGRI